MGGGPRLDPQTRVHFGQVGFGCDLNVSPHASGAQLGLDNGSGNCNNNSNDDSNGNLYGWKSMTSLTRDPNWPFKCLDYIRAFVVRRSSPNGGGPDLCFCGLPDL